MVCFIQYTAGVDVINVRQTLEPGFPQRKLPKTRRFIVIEFCNWLVISNVKLTEGIKQTNRVTKFRTLFFLLYVDLYSQDGEYFLPIHAVRFSFVQIFRHPLRQTVI